MFYLCFYQGWTGLGVINQVAPRAPIRIYDPGI